VSLEKLKLTKQIINAANEVGITEAKEIQQKTMSRIIGGQDIIAIANKGEGKTTAYVFAVLLKLKYAFEEAPRALVVVPDKETADVVVEQFTSIGKYTSLRILGLTNSGNIETQMDSLADGTDIVIGTPDRLRALYLKLGLNLNKIKMLILDDADKLVKNGFTLPVTELSRSIGKTQRMLFTEVLPPKLQGLIDIDFNFPATIEIEQMSGEEIPTIPLQLYHFPNFQTKFNMLLWLLKDQPEKKFAVIVNTQATAEKLDQRMNLLQENKSVLYDFPDDLNRFLSEEPRNFIFISNENLKMPDLVKLPVVIQYEIPDKTERIIELITRAPEEQSGAVLFFATDIELIPLKKVENSVGKRIPVTELPKDLIIEKPEEKQVKAKKEEEDPTGGGAFHKKSEKNSKDYNYGYKEKRAMQGKVSKRRRD
jgi:ATP-dependent RNA helicase RhlE